MIISPSLPSFFPLPSFFIFSSGSSLLSCNFCRLLSLSFSHQKCNSKDWPGTWDLLCCHKCSSKHCITDTHTLTHNAGVCCLNLSLPLACEKYLVSRSLETEVFAFSHSRRRVLLCSLNISVCPAQARNIRKFKAACINHFYTWWVNDCM